MSSSKPEKKMKRGVGRIVVTIAAWAALGMTGAASAQTAQTQPSGTQNATTTLISSGLGEGGNLTLMTNKSATIITRVPFKSVSVANPDVADVNPVAATQVLVTAKHAGSTQLVFWDDAGRSQSVDVVVNFDLKALQDQLKLLFPGASIEAVSANGAIVLRGHVPDVQSGLRAVQVATPYAASVLNFLEVSGGQQVMLKVRFAEVSRSLTENLGFNAFATDGRFTAGINNAPGASPVGGLASHSSGTTIPNVPVFGGGQMGQASFEFFVDALRQNNLLRVLAEPNLTAISGSPAEFLAGGKFPVPVPQTSGGGGTAITVDYKEFGIRLAFTPTVLGNGHIRLEVAPEVSDLDFTNSVSFNGFVIPSITTRNLHTTVELNEGQTFALAGLLNNRVTANKTVTPLLGDIPVLGALFRSVRYVRDETELVVMVTPVVVSPINPGQVPRLPGELWRYPNEAQLFAFQDLGGPAPDLSAAPAANPPQFRGRYGFSAVQSTDGR
jgi:pilus assembly protein CpaC